MSNYNKSFANLNYDTCALQQKERENKHHFELATDVNYGRSNNTCFVPLSPFSHNPNKSIPGNKIDIESDLFGQTRPLSKCATEKYPIVNCKQCNNCNCGLPCNCKHCKLKKQNTKECSHFLEPEYTRVKRPCNVLSGININRFDILCEDYQSLNKIQDNCYIGNNTRLYVRDLFSKTNNRAKE
jgi:hypothetical protein